MWTILFLLVGSILKYVDPPIFTQAETVGNIFLVFGALLLVFWAIIIIIAAGAAKS